jgi:tetratricopeptide (TPR) repeat protein
VPLCSAILAIAPRLLVQAGRIEGSPGLRRILVAILLAAAHFPFGMILPCVAAGRKRPAGDLYAVSALGGVAGAWGFAEVLAPRSALDDLGLALGIATLLAGGPMLLARGKPEAPEEFRAKRTGRRSLVLVFLLGLLGLVTETLWLQLLGFYWESNARTFAFVTAITVGGLSTGSALAGRGNPAGTMLGSAASLAIAAACSPLVLDGGWAVAALLIGIPAAFGGATFTRILNRDEGALALILGANTAGSAAGPLLLWVAAPGLSWPARVLLFVACGYGLLVSMVVSRRQATAAAAAVAILAVGGSILLPSTPPPAAYRLGPTDFAATVMPFASAGLDSTVAVTRDTRTGVDILWIDRGFQGDTSVLGQRIPTILGKVPCDLLGRPPGRTMAIGLGTGVTLAAMAGSGAERIEVAELSRGVIEANCTVLAEVNDHVLERTNVRVNHEDGRARLLDASEPFDLIVTDMIFPTVVGAGNLFSREFYALARRRLAADGVFVHWLPCFLLAPEDLSSVTAAFLESFPEATAWFGYIGPDRLILGLAGGAPPAAFDRFALGPAELRRLAGAAAPLRDADPRLEFRSNRDTAGFGRENLLRVLEGLRSADLGEDERRERSRQGWLRMAEAALAGRREASLALYREAARLTPDPEDAEFEIRTLRYEGQLELARRAAEGGDEDTALRYFRQAASNPVFGGGNLGLAKLLAARGHLKSAVAECEQAARKNRRSADAHITLAWLACAASDFDRAREAFSTACRLRPDLPPFYEELGRRLAQGK